MTRILSLVIFLFGFPVTAQVRELSFYEVNPTDTPPVIDGRLDEKVWKNVPAYSTYYEYWKPDPKESPLKTEFMMLYDRNGIYLAAVHYENAISKLKKNVRVDHVLDIWMDDCAELFFDPAANGISYTKFSVNAFGAKHDMRRQDTAVFLWEWNGTGWTAKASEEKDRWIVEAFFPWEDLGKTARAGDVWQFCHMRFSWTNGFVGAVSSPGGNYASTNHFGYLYFSDGKKKLNLPELGKLLSAKVEPPWSLSVGTEILMSSGNEPEIGKLDIFLRKESDEAGVLLAEIKALHPEKFQKVLDPLLAEFEDIGKQQPDSKKLGRLRKLNLDLHHLKWKIQLDQNFN